MNQHKIYTFLSCVSKKFQVKFFKGHHNRFIINYQTDSISNDPFKDQILLANIRVSIDYKLLIKNSNFYL